MMVLNSVATATLSVTSRHDDQHLSSAILRALATSGLGHRRFAAADLTGEADDEFTQEGGS